jgi:ABC-2 type transport system permease protein
MRGLWKLTLTEAKLYLREPMATFFTIAYAPLLLILFGSIYGNKPEEIFGGRGTMDISVPSYMALIIVSVALMSIPISVSTNREQGVLRRFRATPLRPLTVILADVITYYVMTLIGVLALAIIGRLVYNVRFDGNALYVLVGFTLGALAFFAFGFLVASVARSARVAQTIGMVLAFPMMFLSGSGMPLEILPESVRRISNFLPLTYVVTLMRGLWFGEAWGQQLTAVAVLLGIMVGATAISVKLFRWE